MPLEFSATPQGAGWRHPKSLRNFDLGTNSRAYSFGPTALNSAPIDNEFNTDWFGDLNNDGDIELGFVGSSAQALIALGIAGANWMDFTFNQVGNALVAYSNSTNVFMWWFDPVAGSVVTTDFGVGQQPSVSLITKKEVSTSDIVLSYRVGTAIKYRLGSERYLIERTVPASPASMFFGGHMATNNRVVFKYV